MVTLGDSSVSVCASANLQCVVWTRTNKGGQLCSWGDIFSDVHPQMRRTQIQCAVCGGNQRTSVVACVGTKCPLPTPWDLGPPTAASSKKKKHLRSPKTEMKTWRGRDGRGLTKPLHLTHRSTPLILLRLSPGCVRVFVCVERVKC